MTLEWGGRGNLLVRRERVVLEGLRKRHSLLYISDLHLWGPWTENIADQTLRAAEMERPLRILLGGDLADAKMGLKRLKLLVRKLARVAPVDAIPGNHDRVPGIHRVREAVVAGGGTWLPDRSIGFSGDDGLRIDATIRTGMKKGEIKILCAHDPSIWEKARLANYRLILAGHLHGLQAVLFHRRGRMYPGAWFWKWNGLRFDKEGSTLLVSRGVSDTIPFRWNCPREVVLCDLTPSTP